MENASKALIIAGAIILSVLLIVLGMYFYNQSSATKEGAGNKMSELEVQQFNSEFENYVGSGKTYNQVVSMLNTIKAKNVQNSEDVTKQIEVANTDAADRAMGSSQTSGGDPRTETYVSGTITTVKGGLKKAGRYTISVGYDTKTGLVYQVGIVEEQTTSE